MTFSKKEQSFIHHVSITVQFSILNHFCSYIYIDEKNKMKFLCIRGECEFDITRIY